MGFYSLHHLHYLHCLYCLNDLHCLHLNIGSKGKSSQTLHGKQLDFCQYARQVCPFHHMSAGLQVKSSPGPDISYAGFHLTLSFDTAIFLPCTCAHTYPFFSDQDQFWSNLRKQKFTLTQIWNLIRSAFWRSDFKVKPNSHLVLIWRSEWKAWVVVFWGL